MWSDNETNQDFLNFRCVADTAVEMIVQANGQPLSIGVSGGWGVGKSSMLKLISDCLSARGDDKYLFVEFNAWLYQGYDDTRAALMEVITQRLIDYGEESKQGLARAKKLLERVDWLRLAGLTVASALPLVAGLPPLPLLSTLLSTGKEPAADAEKVSIPRAESSPPRQIQDLRKDFEETLSELGVTLVVFIDDLDRCLPATAIATLEAMRLFLFLQNTAFVIAADDRMIRQAVRIHFNGENLNDDLVTNYFDKLIQIPLRVPPLGTQEVRAYLSLLFIENSGFTAEERERLRKAVCDRLSESWKGHRVDSQFVSETIGTCPEELRANLQLADRLAPLMTTTKQIAGNPRLIKRFLNTLSIRLEMARAQNVAVDEGALAKMLLFERCATEEAYLDLVSAINDGGDGKPHFLRDWEESANAGKEIADLRSAWTSPFVREWLALPPAFALMDLRAVVYVSREHMPIIASGDRLSSEAVDILNALLALDGSRSKLLSDRLRSLPGREITLITEGLMIQARQEQEWGTPPVLWGLLTVIEADPEQARTFAQFLDTIPRVLLKPDIVPVIDGLDWARAALDEWSRDRNTLDIVKKAITVMRRGNPN